MYSEVPTASAASRISSAIFFFFLKLFTNLNLVVKPPISVGGLHNMRYTKDTALFAATEEELVKLIRRVESNKVEKLVYYRINGHNIYTKIIIVDGSNNNALFIRFTYQGTLISNEGCYRSQIRRCIVALRYSERQIPNCWIYRNISNHTKQCLSRTLVSPIVLYGAEIWSNLETDRMRVNALKMWMWNRMLSTLFHNSILHLL